MIDTFLTKPTQCHLWQKEGLTDEDLNLENNFELLRTFEDESHLTKRLLKCKECGQLYFYEFYEVVDWVGGHDPQYRTFIPIETEDAAGKMAEMWPHELFQFWPRLQDDWVSEKKKSIVYWMGK